ncbi:MAG: CoA-binding protein [Crocinitomicaceae bacterium]|nr:CoA-binding protein [Crocinitomicaceae bacterium]
MRKKYTLVIGASENPERYSYKAIKALLGKGKDVKAFGQRKGEVDGIFFETVEKPIEDIDTVTLYVGPKNQPSLYDFILNDIQPRRIIFNPGTENQEFYDLARPKGIICEEVCTLVLLATGQYD